ncbi:MFS transporter [Antrihabitans sp. YC2-6]|nr:MFS transporter [Antrihabitans sp. YC2-6]
MWVVHIPAITDRTGVSKSALGLPILLLAAGAVVGMQLAGPLADRYGSRIMVGLGAVIVSASLIGPGLAGSPAQLGIALFVLGFGNGGLDVSMNAQAVYVERAYERPIMSAFHAFFSCGGVAGALLGAATLHAGWDIRVSLGLAAVLSLALTAVFTPRLLPHVRPVHAQEKGAVAKGGRTPARVWALGGVAFAVLLCEGVANDWSALQVKEHLDASDATAALAFGAFSTMMTLGRFGADRVAGALGPVAIVRYGTLIAGVGMLFVVTSDWVALTLFGWGLFGLGLSGAVPQIFTAAGNLNAQSAGVNMSRVFSMGYLAFLAGPSLIGALTKVMPLTTAMLVPLAGVLFAAVAANVVETTSSAQPERAARSTD